MAKKISELDVATTITKDDMLIVDTDDIGTRCVTLSEFFRLLAIENTLSNTQG